MGKLITIIVVILILFGAYYLIQNRAATNTANNTFASSTVASSSSSGATTTGSTTTSGSGNASSTEALVTISSTAFNPATTTIELGTKVTWTNRDSATHTVTSTTGNELNSPRLAEGQSYSHTFNKVGTFNYHCSVHPNMKGVVVVTK